MSSDSGGPAPAWVGGSVNRDVAVRDLVTSLVAEPWGQVSPSVYETARLVTLAPWLDGHIQRIAYLLSTQRADGGWGPPDGYALVPTLSATEALLATLRAGERGHDGKKNLTAAADRGLRALTGWLQQDLSVPDTPAADLIVPALVAAINQHLDHLQDTPITGFDAWRVDLRLGLPTGMSEARLASVRHGMAAGTRLTGKLLHFLEVLQTGGHRTPGIRPVPPGTIGASPAATAVWLGGPDTPGAVDPGRAFLEALAGRHSGPVPCPTPITVFERAWVLSGLMRAGVPVTVPPDLMDSLGGALGPVGTSTGPGLPTDADTTSVALYALAKLGKPVDPLSLWTYETDEGFCTWPGEDGFSVTTNAHVLDAFGQHLRTNAAASPRYLAAAKRLSVTLREHQDRDGMWRDRWHASPYYATACCSLALDEFGHGPAATEAVARAVDWVLATQRSDGSWGRWYGTPEETAYALQVLLSTRAGAPGIEAAAKRGWTYLRDAAGRETDPPLWYGKELYRPIAIVRGAVLAAMRLGQQQPGVTLAAGMSLP